MIKYEQFIPCLITGFLMVVLFSVPGIAGMLIITETDNNITAEYTGSATGSATAPKNVETKPEKAAKAEKVIQRVKAPAANENPDKPLDRRIQRQTRQRSLQTPEAGK